MAYLLILITCLSFLTTIYCIDVPTYKLSDGNCMPAIGFGTFRMSSEEIDSAVTTALEIGYRHIDTASLYYNENDIGNTLKKWFAKGNKREDLYITTKLPVEAMRPSDVSIFLNKSMEKLGVDYIDMYLIHLPFGFFVTPEFNPVNVKEGSFELDYNTDHVAIWKEMEKQVKAGKVRSIGLSNFNKTQIFRVWKNAEIKPTNLQIEANTYIQQEELLKLCNKLGIVMTGYSPLASGGTTHIRRKRETLALPPLIQHPVVTKIAKRHGKTPAQIVLRHGLQRNIIVIPKSTHPKRIKENFDILNFKLTKREMKALKALDQHGKYRKFDFLTFKNVETHPEYPFADKIPK